MKNFFTHKFLLINAFLILIALPALTQDFKAKASKKGKGKLISDPHAEVIPLKGDWLIKSSTQVRAGGNVISTADFSPRDWYPTSVPTTVLNALIKNGVYPDPRVGMNNFLIPDASPEFNSQYDLKKYSHLPDNRNPWKDPYWYRTEFSVPDDYRGKQIWLNFDGINYRASVWLNGHKIADSENMVGMFRRFKFNITEYTKLREENYLAVKIFNIDHIGNPAPPQSKLFGPMRGKDWESHKDVTLKISGGWDCAPVVRDRNMGIWQEVYLEITGPVDISNPHIVTDLPLPDTSKAKLTITTEIKNVTSSPQNGLFTIKIYPHNFKGDTLTIEDSVRIKGKEKKQIAFTPDSYNSLIIDEPHLWWPINYGKQNLYKLFLSFKTKHGVSDTEEITFGIREVNTDMKTLTGAFGKEYGLIFFINGERVFCKGGWIQPDILLNNDKERCEHEARLLSEANMNTIASEDWPSYPDDWIEACDKYGIMWWEDFYQCWKMRPGTPSENYPLNHEVSKKSNIDIIKRYRNHPSLVLWVAANETVPAEDLYVHLKKNIHKLDGTRPFIPSTNVDWNVEKLTPWIKEEMPIGMYDSRPGYVGTSYNWNDPSNYFRKVREVKNAMFLNEMGQPALPDLNSIEKFIPNLGKVSEGAPYPLNNVWAHHGALMKGYFYSGYDKAIRDRYGEPESVADYVLKGQMVQANGYRAMFEAANHRLWDITSGWMLWKLNSCWPTTIWQIYDWYLNTNAAYYYTKKACEPIHVQLNDDHSVYVINTLKEPINGLKVVTEVYAINMDLAWSNKQTIQMGSDSYKEVLENILEPSPRQGVPYFVRLKLIDKDGKMLSENFYWLSASNDYTKLQGLLPVELNVETELDKRGKENVVNLRLKNPSDNLAFFVKLNIIKGSQGEEVLPTFWSDNYFSILPGESKTIEARFYADDLNGKVPHLILEGWNIEPKEINIKSGEEVTPEFEYTEFIAPNEVEVGDLFEVNVSIKNSSALGKRITEIPLYLYNDGKVMESTRIGVKPGERKIIKFCTSINEPGTHRLRVGTCKPKSIEAKVPKIF